MNRSIGRIGLALIFMSVLTACGGGGSPAAANPTTPPVTPPAVADTSLDWDEGNWDEEDWQ